jgi:hypothetical protein
MDLGNDGKRFLLSTGDGSGSATPLTVVTNLGGEVEEVMGSGVEWSARAMCVNVLARICAGGDQRSSSLRRQLTIFGEPSNPNRPQTAFWAIASVKSERKPRRGLSRLVGDSPH